MNRKKPTNTGYSPAHPRRIFLYTFKSIIQKVYTQYPLPSNATDCLLPPLLQDHDKLPIVHELYELYFIYIRNLRKDATYGTLLSRKKQLLNFQDNIKDRLNFLYQAAVSNDNLEQFLDTWKKLINRNGKINLPPI